MCLVFPSLSVMASGKMTTPACRFLRVEFLLFPNESISFSKTSLMVGAMGKCLVAKCSMGGSTKPGRLGRSNTLTCLGSMMHSPSPVILKIICQMSKNGYKQKYIFMAVGLYYHRLWVSRPCRVAIFQRVYHSLPDTAKKWQQSNMEPSTVPHCKLRSCATAVDQFRRGT